MLPSRRLVLSSDLPVGWSVNVETVIAALGHLPVVLYDQWQHRNGPTGQPVVRLWSSIQNEQHIGYS